MGKIMAEELATLVDAVLTIDDLRNAMEKLTIELGFQYFALSHHADLVSADPASIRLHNYPVAWEDYYESNRLSVADPVHRASHVTSVGFCWSNIPDMIALTAGDRRILAMGRAEGIGDGFTVPANVPGEVRGSCSFANDAARALPHAVLPMAHLAGAFAFEAARKLWRPRGMSLPATRPLTDRQRDCVLWAARGKSDWEISQILGVSEETIANHFKDAFARYRVSKRTMLAVRTLSDGTLTFEDILKRT